MCISIKEREYLRDLAKKQLEYARHPDNARREQAWYAHNDLRGVRPLILVEEDSFFHEVERKPRCESEDGRRIEDQLLRNLIGREDIGDDRVTPDFYRVYRHSWFLPFGLREKCIRLAGSEAYEFIPYIEDLKSDFHKLKKSSWGCDLESPAKEAKVAADVLGDILPIRPQSDPPFGSLTYWLIRYMSMETLFFALHDAPEYLRRAMEMLTSDLIESLRDLEASGYFISNSGNQRVPQGTYAFTNDLPRDKPNALLSEMWGYLDSQETVGISPSQFKEFFHPYHERVAGLFGLVNYGCCEPVHAFWDECVSRIPRLRKVSVSAWCDEVFMGDRLRGARVIYHRKPSPNYIGVEAVFDEEAFCGHIRRTLEAAKGCKLEFAFRDIYTLKGDKYRARRAVGLVRELIEERWE